MGEDALTYAGKTLGAKGVISVSANVVPQKMHDICELCDKGEYKTARELQFSVNPLIDTLFCEVNPIPVKKAMAYLGYGNGIPRLPLTEMEEQNAQKLMNEMKKLALI